MKFLGKLNFVLHYVKSMYVLIWEYMFSRYFGLFEVHKLKVQSIPSLRFQFLKYWNILIILRKIQFCPTLWLGSKYVLIWEYIFSRHFGLFVVRGLEVQSIRSSQRLQCGGRARHNWIYLQREDSHRGMQGMEEFTRCGSELKAGSFKSVRGNFW